MTNAVSIAQSGSSNQTFRNWIVNGGFDVWQRGTSLTGVNTWTVDRFFNTNTSMTWTKASNTLGGPCANMCTLTGGDTSSRFRFSFELPSSTNQAPFTVGSYWTLSLYTDFDLTGRTMNVGFADNPNGTTETCSTTATWVSLGNNRWSLTVQIDTLNTNNRLAMRFSGPFNGPVNHGVSSISITGVQFEAGTVATPFEIRPYMVELALCQRYLNIVASDNDQPVPASWNFTSTTAASGDMFLSIPMRTVPSAAQTATSYRSNSAGLNQTITATISIATQTTNRAVRMDISGYSGAVAGQGTNVRIYGSASGSYFGFSAEL